MSHAARQLPAWLIFDVRQNFKHMKPLPPFAALFGLGAPELIVILIILAILAAVAAVVVWIFVAIVRRGNGNQASLQSHAQKKCPDCAEFVRAEARVCKHCGYRFDVEPPKA
jgi:hypothetical protein